eukprot:s344_g14.t2
MLNLYAKVENGWGWPHQLTRGHVFCLQKVKNKYDVANYRPVVLFSLWYRLWSSLQSRHYLSQLEGLASFPAFGFLTGRSCRDLTYAVQTAIELAIGKRSSLCGGLFDIEKCFNFIPRAPVFFLARWFGVAESAVVGWTSFLQQMHRSFLAHNEPSDAVLSGSGLPEGDGLSCLGMVLLDFSFHHYMRHFQPGINELSFVDNLELISVAPGQLLSGVLTLETWAELFQLRIDSRKTQFWALCPEHRKSLASLGLSVVETACDLGASMSFSAKHLNSPLQHRILQTMPFWAKLRKLNVSPWFKLLAIKMALLPRALHAASSVCLGDSWFVKLRTQVMRALKVSRGGAWTEYYTTVNRRKTYGPFAKLLALFAKLGWSMRTAQLLQLEDGFHMDIAWLDLGLAKKLLTYYWKQYMVQTVAKRPNFSDLRGINEAASFFQMAGLDHATSELLNCIRDGTTFLNSVKAKFDPGVSPLCSCGLAEDSIEHRALVCPQYRGTRESFSDVERMWFALPVSMTHHGLAPANPWQTMFWAALNTIPWGTPVWMGGRPPAVVQNLFTDVSCSDPAQPMIALGGWRLVSATMGQVVGAGLMPTCWHSSDRCEIWAVVMALAWLAHWQCLAMFDGSLALKKVAAHQVCGASHSAEAQFCIFWNSVADKAAKTARLTGLTSDQRSIYQSHCRTQAWHRYWAERCQRFLLALAVSSVGDSQECDVLEVVDLEEPLTEFPFEANCSDLAEAYPVDWRSALAANQRILDFGHATGCAFAQWLLDQSHNAQLGSSVVVANGFPLKTPMLGHC